MKISPMDVDIQLYKYNNKAYVKTEVKTALKAGSHELKIVDDAAKGTYRLEFTYHDRTEYWDFIVK